MKPEIGLFISVAILFLVLLFHIVRLEHRIENLEKSRGLIGAEIDMEVKP